MSPWVMITKKPPTKPSPPKMSIHYATPWPDAKIVKQQKEAYSQQFPGGEREWLDYGGEIDEDADYFVPVWPGGLEDNWRKAMKINYKGEDIRIFPREVSILTPERMRDYVFGLPGEDIPSHELVPNRESDAMLLRAAMETSLRDVYDAAMIDGCGPEMAQAVAMGLPIEDVAFEFPNIGWYRCKREFAEFYAYDWELEE